MTTRDGRLTKAQIDRVFKEMGLGTQRQRDALLRMEPIVEMKPSADRIFVTQSSNNSWPQTSEEHPRAELG